MSNQKETADELAAILRMAIREAPIKFTEEQSRIEMSARENGDITITYGLDNLFIVKTDGKVFVSNSSTGVDFGEIPVMMPLTKTGLGLAVLYLTDMRVMHKKMSEPKQSPADAMMEFFKGFEKSNGGMIQ